MKLPAELVQAALVSQLSVSAVHSSKSEECMGLIGILHHLSLHLSKLPVYQVQVKLPGVFVQAALVSQLSVSVVHASISVGYCYSTKAMVSGAMHGHTRAIASSLKVVQPYCVVIKLYHIQ